MIENFDWLNSNIKMMKNSIYELYDLEFLDTVNIIEKDGQDRIVIHDIIRKCCNLRRLELYGFDMNLIDLLLNSVPIYDKEKTRGSYTDEVRDSVFKRDNSECRLCCNIDSIICHHIIPNGPGKKDNLITLCSTCHMCIHLLLRNKGYVYTNPVNWNNRW